MQFNSWGTRKLFPPFVFSVICVKNNCGSRDPLLCCCHNRLSSFYKGKIRCLLLLKTEKYNVFFLPPWMLKEQASSRKLLTLITVSIKPCLSTAFLLVYHNFFMFSGTILHLLHSNFISYGNYYYSVCIWGSLQWRTLLFCHFVLIEHYLQNIVISLSSLVKK